MGAYPKRLGVHGLPGSRLIAPNPRRTRVESLKTIRLVTKTSLKVFSDRFARCGLSGMRMGHLAFCAGCPSFFVWAGYYSVAYTNAPCHKWLFAHSSMEEFMEELSAFVPFVSFVCFVHMRLTCGFSFVCFVSFVRICLKTEFQVQLIEVPSYGRHFCY